MEHPEEKLVHLLGYIGEVRDTLRMQNWDIILHRTVCEDEECHARTWQEPYHTTLNIEIGPGLFDEAPHRIRNVVVHELVHAQHRDVSVHWEACTVKNSSISEDESHAWDEDFRMFMERFVSWVTRNIAPTIPAYKPRGAYRNHDGVYMLGDHG